MFAAANYTWYVARAGGILAYALLTSSIVLGLLLSGRARLSGWPRFALEDVHGFVGLLAGTVVLIHVGALLLDSYLPFSLTNLVVPGTAPYRPVSVAFGVVAAELLAALALTNHYRKELSHRFWRRAHYLNFPGLAARARPRHRRRHRPRGAMGARAVHRDSVGSRRADREPLRRSRA